MKKHSLKRLFDIIVSLLAIIITGPFSVVIALAIKIEGLLKPSTCGPVFHKELRISEGKVFKMFKFRTVKVKFLSEVKKNPEKSSISLIMYTKPESVTKVGRFLMKHYFDELPQIFNVLSGQMSIVGPRPQLPSIYQNRLKNNDYSLKYLKSGICGLIQSCKKSPKIREQLVKFYKKKYPHWQFKNLDQVYLKKYRNYSGLYLAWFDLKLIWATFIESMRGKGAAKHLTNLYS